jgi:signal transduction histidine kinase
MRHLLRSRIFRYGVAYAALFFISTLLVLTFLYSYTFRISANKVEERIANEAGWLSEILSTGSEFDKVSRLNFHIADHPGSLGIYLLVDKNGKRLAGNLDLTPEADVQPGKFTTFFHQDDKDKEGPPLNISATMVELGDGCRLLVGNNNQALDQIKLELRPAVMWSLGISFVLGVLVAFFLAARLAARLEKINRTSRSIFEGNLETRMENTGSGDEFDHLGNNLNRMLDRIFNLMESVRGVTDNIAHDLRSPLSRMRSRMEVALIADRPCAEYKEILAQTVDDTDHLLTTFNSLLTIARVESGAARDDFAVLDLQRVVTDTVEMYTPAVEENGQSLKMSCPGDLQMNGNPDLLVQALANLLDNSVKYAQRGAEIRVAAQSEGEFIVLSVTDNGPGIPENFRDKALQRFTRLDKSRTRSGQGLGLSLVQVVAEMHGGSVSLQDANPGLRVEVELAPGSVR